MKKIAVFLFGMVLLAGIQSVSAQKEQNSLQQVESESQYGSNWFVSLGGYANLLHAEQDGLVSYTDRIRPGAGLTIGKWFTPDFGSRIQIMGGQLRGFNMSTYINPGSYGPNRGPYPIGGNPLIMENRGKYHFLTAKNGQEGFWQDFNYGSVTFDLMANMTNLFRGHYKAHSIFEFAPFAGAGVIFALDNKVTTPTTYYAVAKVGFRLNVNITDKFAIYLEPQASFTTPDFDGYHGTAFADGISNCGFGIQYTFNRKFTSLAQLTSDEIERLNKKINDNRYMIENHQNVLERQQNMLDRLDKRYEESNKNTGKDVVTQVVEKGCLPEYVRFALDSYKLDPIEQHKIAEIVTYLKSDPSIKLLIIGYADKRTGNSKYNMNLSQRRAEAVAAEIKRLGISGNRLLLEWKGDSEQPFPQNEWNRVTILVERK